MQFAMIEQKVKIKVFTINYHSFLSLYKSEAIA